MKRKISVSSKKNFTIEREVRNLDQKIALLIRNRISLEVWNALVAFVPHFMFPSFRKLWSLQATSLSSTAPSP
jgi:hypothetical protein